MPDERIFCQQILEHLFVIGQERRRPEALHTDCHVYLIEGDTSALAVDAGGGNLWPYVRAVMKAHGFAEKLIGHVLVTHGHGDHARGLSAFEEQGALTVSSTYTADHLDSMEDADVLFGRDGVLDLDPFHPEVILTPGHTPGSATYRMTVDGQVCLFTGDLVQPDGGLGWCGSEGFSEEQVLASLRRLADLSPPPDLLLAGHGVIHDPVALLRKAIAFGESGRWVVWEDERPTMPEA